MVAQRVDKSVALEINKYRQYKKEIQNVIQQNENILKLKTPMTVSALKADYDKFYNNPDKTKQDRYQAWLKMVAKDIQVNESSKLLTAFAKPNLIAKKGQRSMKVEASANVKTWHVIYTKSKWEKKVDGLLTKNGFDKNI